MSKFNRNAIDNIDQDTVESDGQQFPAISFHSGSPAQKKAGGVSYEGGWFIAEDDAPADMTEHGWKRDSFMTESGTEVVGFWSSTITIAALHRRQRWLVEGKPYTWNDYDAASKAGNPRGHQQYLVLLKGAEALGPFIIGLKGHAGMAFTGSRAYAATGAMACMNRTVIAAANALTKPRKWPFRAFWLTVGAAKNAKGEPEFTEVGKAPNSSRIVLPVPVGLPDKAANVNLDDFYVGDEVLALANQTYTETADWASAWDSFTGAEHRNGATAGNDADEVAEEISDEEMAAAGL